MPQPSAHCKAYTILYGATQAQFPIKGHTMKCPCLVNLLFVTLEVHGLTNPEEKINAIITHFHLSRHLKEVSFTMTPSYSNALYRVFFCLINNLTDNDERCPEIQLACQWPCFLIILIMSRCFPALSTPRHSQGKQKLPLACFLLPAVCYL